MKLIIGLLALSLSVASMASTGETKSFLYDGSQESVELLLRGEKTHTEYRVEDLPSTCYRNEVVGYHTVCTGGHYGPYPRPYPHPYPGPHHPGPHPYPRTCYREPIYRQIPYSCIRTVRTPYEVKDFDVDTKVVLNVVRNGEAVPAEKFTVTLRGDQLTLMMDGSKRYVGVVKNESIKEQMAGSVKVIDAVYNVELVDTQEVVAAIQLKRIAMNKGVVELKAGKFADRGDLGLSLTIVKKKALATDEILLDRILTAGEYDAQAEDAIATNIDVNTQALGLNLKGGKFSITAKLFLKGKVLNRIQLPELEASRTLIYKN